MNKYLFLLSIILLSCSKEEKPTRTSIRQQPTKIGIFSVDTSTFIENLQYEIKYFFNDSTERFDSINVAGINYAFNYSKLVLNNTILLNYTNTTTPFEALIFEDNFFSLTQYNKINPLLNDTVKNRLQFENGNRIISLSSSQAVVNDNFDQSFMYKNDSIFIKTQRPLDACETNDTIIQSFYELNAKLPYWLFLQLSPNCGSVKNTILEALPISNYINKLPFKKVNGNTETTYVFKGDSNFRLGEALITSKKRNTNELISINKIKVTY